ncbi:MAG: type IV pilus assembly protein PilW [Gammaproteobacteria bacterium]|jgi:type IV pilus assembly protein PilW
MNNRPMKKHSHQLGISLVEILVSLVISLFLVGGIFQVYLGNKTSYNFTSAISRIQENGRYAMDTMSQDLRMAGFFGCALFDPTDPSNIVNNLNPAGAGYDPDLHDFLLEGAISGTENDGLNGSDSVTLRGSKPNQVNVLPPYNVSSSANLHVTPNNHVVQGDIVMVSNCRGADIFQITNISNNLAAATNPAVHNTGNTTSPGNYNPDSCKGGAGAHCLSQTYGAESSLFELQSVTYSIAAGASGEPALWRSENGVNAELVEGIEQLQILYGIDTDDDDFPNQYVTITSAAVPDMLEVISLRIMLLARSDEDFISDENQKYTFNGADLTAGDRRLRQIFTTTIALRNRIGSGT